MLGLDLPHCGNAGLLIGHVELENPTSRLVQLAQILDPPRRGPRRKAGLHQCQGGRPSDTRGTPRDQHGT
jgi:hypothetical protein